MSSQRNMKWRKTLTISHLNDICAIYAYRLLSLAGGFDVCVEEWKIKRLRERERWPTSTFFISFDILSSAFVKIRKCKQTQEIHNLHLVCVCVCAEWKYFALIICVIIYLNVSRDVRATRTKGNKNENENEIVISSN